MELTPCKKLDCANYVTTVVSGSKNNFSQLPIGLVVCLFCEHFVKKNYYLQRRVENTDLYSLTLNLW